MSDLAIASAATLTGTTIAAGDLIPVVDVSAAAGSKGSMITLTELFTGRSLVSTVSAAFRDASAAFDVTLAFNSSSSALTAGRTLTVDVGNAARSITLAGNLTVPATGTAALLGTTNTFTNYQQFTDISNPGLPSSTTCRVWNTSTEFYIANAFSAFVVSNGGGSTLLKNSIGGFINIGYGLGISSDGFGNNTTRLMSPATGTLQLGVDAAGVTNHHLKACNRITSDGVGANLTISGGNGRGGNGGSLILATYTTAGAATAGALANRLVFSPNGGDTRFYSDGGHTLMTLGYTSGRTVGLYGATAVTQPTRRGQLTDNSSGTSGGNTIAAIGVDTVNAASQTDTANAIATLAAKVNAIETVLSAAGGGIGLTA